MEWLEAIAQTDRVRTIAALILLDILLGIGQAIKEGRFDWNATATFYRSMIVPALIGYVAVAGLVPLMVADLLGEFSEALGQGIIWVAWGALVAQLVTSVLSHAKALGWPVIQKALARATNGRNWPPEDQGMAPC